MRHLATTAIASVVLATHGTACTWTRFDDVLENSPVQILDSPPDSSAIGLSVAALRIGTSTRAFARASDSYASYEFGDRDLRSNDATSRGVCSPSEGCWLANVVAPIRQETETGARACFAFGVEKRADEPARAVLSCSNDTVRGLRLPDPIPSDLAALRPGSKAPWVSFAAAPRLSPDFLAAASRSSGAVWFYPVDASTPVAVAKPETAGSSFGTSLAAAGIDTSRFVVVGEPEAGRVYIWPTDGVSAPDSFLCLSGSKNFAAYLASGHFTSAESEDLAIASDTDVVLVPSLPTLPYSADPATPCVDVSTLETARSIGCQVLNSGNPCGGLLASAALAAADLDSDGRDELLIGTPGASSRGNDAAGKVLVTSFDQGGPRVIEELSPSSAESGDRLGTSITGIPLSRPEVVLAGAPGGNKLAAFFCTSLLGAGKGGARCD